MAPPDDDPRREAILDAASAKFSAYGFDRTSMADLADAAGMSRPALYQHYANKQEIFTAMLERIFGDAADKALAALDEGVDLAEQLDGFLQRWSGDLTEAYRAAEHGGDITEAKTSFAKPVLDAVSSRVRGALRRHLAAAGADRPDELAEIVLLAPLGFKYDEPSMAKLRRRLRRLAGLVAVEVGVPR